MMKLAEEDAEIDIGATVIGTPADAMMHLAVGRGHRANSPHASAIATCECDSLLRAEEPLFATQVERIPPFIDGRLDVAGVAVRRVDQRRRKRLTTVFGEADAWEPTERVALTGGGLTGHDEANPRAGGLRTRSWASASAPARRVAMMRS